MGILLLALKCLSTECTFTCRAPVPVSTTLPLFAGFMLILALGLNSLIFLFILGFLGALYFCFCKECSTDENNDSSWNSPIGLKLEFSLNDLCSKKPPDGVSLDAS